MNGKAAVARSLCAPIFPIEDLAASIRRAGDGVLASVPISEEHRIGEGQHGGRFVAAHQQEFAGHVLVLLAFHPEHQTAGEIGDVIAVGRRQRGGGIFIIHPRNGDTVGVAIHGERAGIFTHIGVEDTVIFVALLVAHFKRDLQFLVLWQEHSIVGRLRFFAVILRGERLWGAGSPAPRSTALCTLRGACLLAFHGAGLRALCRARPCTLREVRHLSIGAHANFVGLVGGQIFRIFRFLTAHGQRHVDGGGVLVKIVAKAGVLPLAF